MTTVKRPSAKPTAGHKCLGLQMWIEVRCECGWRSDTLRPNERAALYAQWREHVAKCGSGE